MKAVLYLKSPDPDKLDVMQTIRSLNEAKSTYKRALEVNAWYGAEGQVHIEGKEPRKITLGKLGKPRIV